MQGNNSNMDNTNITQTSKKKGKVILIVGILLIIAIIGMVLYFISQKGKEDEMGNTDNTVSSSMDESEDIKDTYAEISTFLLTVEDVFTITGRGTVATGTIEQGTIKVGDTVQIIGLDGETITTEITGIEMFREVKETAEEGDNVALLLKDIEREQLEPGQLIIKTE